jgi:methylaspartate ammonia-lyase
MIHISQVLAVPAVGAYYIEDLTALQEKPIPLPERYTAAPVTAGFRAVRQVAEGVSVGLVLEGPAGAKQVAWGDCVAVAYSGKAGREPVFSAQEGIAIIQEVVAPMLQGRSLTNFRDLAAELDALTEWVTITRLIPQPEPDLDSQPGTLSRRDLLAAPVRFFRSVQQEIESEKEPKTEQITVERPLHTAVRYGVSQALLGAVALARGVTPAEVIAREWDLALPDAPIPIHAQSGSERYHGADKAIARRVASLPHALVDDIPEQVGEDGSKVVRYARWLAKRIQQLGGDDYRPTIHLDMHGALGKIFDDQPGKILGQLYALEKAAQPYRLRVECPVIMESRSAQIEMMKTLRDYVRFRKMKVQLVADEWANTLDDIRTFVDAGAADMIQIKMPDLGSVHNSVDAVLLCQDAGVGAFLGGSCAETDLSARMATHVALATRPDILMAKPGMGVDEGVSLVNNEMVRTLAQIAVANGARTG